LADRYGLLEEGERLVGYGPVKEGEGLLGPEYPGTRVATGESIIFWRETICHLRLLNALWKRVCKGQRDKLRPFVRWNYFPEREVQIVLVSTEGRLLDPETRATRILFGEYQKKLAAAKVAGNQDQVRALGVELDQALFAEIEKVRGDLDSSSVRRTSYRLRMDEDRVQVATWTDEDPEAPLRYFIQQEINGKLRGHVSPQVSPLHRGGIVLVPHTLLAQLYLSLARMITRESPDMVQCAVTGCGREFIPRSNKECCSDTCRSKKRYRVDNGIPV